MLRLQKKQVLQPIQAIAPVYTPLTSVKCDAHENKMSFLSNSAERNSINKRNREREGTKDAKKERKKERNEELKKDRNSERKK